MTVNGGRKAARKTVRTGKSPPHKEGRIATRPSNPKGQKLGNGRPVTTTSTFSARLLGLRDQLERELRRLFGNRIEAVTAYNMHGWRIRRRVTIAAWKGTMDPNFVHIFVAERKSGITLFLWDPFEPLGLKRREQELSAAGFKVMVGCLQFNRKSECPVAVVVALFASIAAKWKAER